MQTRYAFNALPSNLLEGMMKTEGYFLSPAFAKGSALEPKLLRLIRYYVSNLNSCAYCMDMHFKEGLAAGETDQRLHSVTAWEQTDYYSELEKAALAWARCITVQSSIEAEEVIYKKLCALLNEEDIAKLALLITQANAWNRLSKAFRFQAGTYAVTNS